jgi:hypothetical protein
VGWESFILLLGFFDLRPRWGGGWALFFDLRVILHWLSYLWDCWGICYLWSWWRLRVVGCSIIVGLIVYRRLSLTGLVSLWKKRRVRWIVLLVMGVPMHGMVDFSRCGLLRSVCGALVHVLLCLQVDGAIFGSVVGVSTVVHAVWRSDCVRASTPTL